MFVNIKHVCCSFLLYEGLQIGDDDLMNLCLIELEKLLYENGRSLKELPTLPLPRFIERLDFGNKFLADELNYNKEEMSKTHEELVSRLTIEQKGVYTQVLNSLFSNNGGFFFLYGFGGT